MNFQMRQHMRHHTEPSPAVEELRELLRSPHLQVNMFAADNIAVSGQANILQLSCP